MEPRTQASAHPNRATVRRIVPLFRPYRAQVAVVVGLIVLTSTIGTVNPLLIQVVFNKALFVPGGPNVRLLVILVAIMAVIPVVNGAIGILQSYETTRVGQLVMRDLRDRLYAHLQTLSLAFFTGTKTSEIQSRLANDVGGVQTVITTTASSILANVVIFVSTIVAMIIISWQLTVVAVITVPVFFWLTRTVGERRRQVARATQESLAAMSALSEETLSVSGVLLAKAFGSQARDTTRYHQENQRLADLEVRQQMIGQGFYAIVQSFQSITPAAVYLVAGLLLAHGTAVSAGTIVAFTTLQTRLYFPIGQPGLTSRHHRLRDPGELPLPRQHPGQRPVRTPLGGEGRDRRSRADCGSGLAGSSTAWARTASWCSTSQAASSCG